MNLSAASTQIVLVPVTATVNGAPYNPTADVVSMAFLPGGQTPGVSDWQPATWQTAGSIYNAACLVGPAEIALAVGVYQVWVQIIDNPEIPVLRAGTLNVT